MNGREACRRFIVPRSSFIASRLVLRSSFIVFVWSGFRLEAVKQPLDAFGTEVQPVADLLVGVAIAAKQKDLPVELTTTACQILPALLGSGFLAGCRRRPGEAILKGPLDPFGRWCLERAFDA